MTVLVLGASGQLATHLRELLPAATYWGRATLDLTFLERAAAAIVAHRPAAIVNAAAYTGVDKAERERDAAWRLNADVPAMLAQAAAALDVPLVHVSTDYVFDGTKTGEYVVEDSCNPVSTYGATKLAGELAVRTLWPKSWILRTSWVFSEYGANFVKTMLRLAQERSELRVVADQFGRPTYAHDLARLVARIVGGDGGDRQLAYGTYHAVGGPAVSWHGFAEAIVAASVRHGRLARAVPVVPIKTSDYPTAARRPSNSVLRPSVALSLISDVEFDWQLGLERAISKLDRSS